MRPTPDAHPLWKALRQAWPVEFAGTVRTIARGRARIAAWLGRRVQRRALAALDDRLLRDIGKTRAEAVAEARKPFWRP